MLMQGARPSTRKILEFYRSIMHDMGGYQIELAHNELYDGVRMSRACYFEVNDMFFLSFSVPWVLVFDKIVFGVSTHEINNDINRTWVHVYAILFVEYGFVHNGRFGDDTSFGTNSNTNYSVNYKTYMMKIVCDVVDGFRCIYR